MLFLSQLLYAGLQAKENKLDGLLSDLRATSMQAAPLASFVLGALQHEEHERANARCLCCSTHTALAGSAYFPLAFSLLFVAFKSTQA